MIWTAHCRCGGVRLRCEGEPLRVSVCHCLACQQRSGSAFSAQARFPSNLVQVEGITRSWVRTADSGNIVTYSFCPECGSTVAYRLEREPGVTAVPLGNFIEADFPAPQHSFWERRKRHWVEIVGDAIEHVR
jgi:hypothetical protein